MLQTIIVLLAVSLDVFSFGLSLGIKGQKLTLFKAVFFVAVSLCLFCPCLALSYLLKSKVSENLLRILNGVALIVLGLVYELLVLIKSLKGKKLAQNCPENESEDNLLVNIHKTTNSAKIEPIYLILNCVPVNLDAMFTILIIGASLASWHIVVILYAIFTFISVFAANRLAKLVTSKLKFKLEWLSGVLFLTLGLLKLLVNF